MESRIQDCLRFPYMGRFISESRAWAWAKLSAVGFILFFRLCVAKDGKMVPFGLHEASSLLSGAGVGGGGNGGFVAPFYSVQY